MKLHSSDGGTDTVQESYDYDGAWYDVCKTKSWSLCLPEAQYRFTIYDTGGDILCCQFAKGEYSLSYGMEVIAQGGDFESDESTVFSIPYVPAPALAPPKSNAPSLSIAPSSMPSLPLSPTEICYCVDINVVADDHPG